MYTVYIVLSMLRNIIMYRSN